MKLGLTPGLILRAGKLLIAMASSPRPSFLQKIAEEVLCRDPVSPLVDLCYGDGDMNHYSLIHYRSNRRLIRRRD